MRLRIRWKRKILILWQPPGYARCRSGILATHEWIWNEGSETKIIYPAWEFMTLVLQYTPTKKVMALDAKGTSSVIEWKMLHYFSYWFIIFHNCGCFIHKVTFHPKHEFSSINRSEGILVDRNAWRNSHSHVTGTLSNSDFPFRFWPPQESGAL